MDVPHTGHEIICGTGPCIMQNPLPIEETKKTSTFDFLYQTLDQFNADPANPRGEHAWDMNAVLMHAHSEITEVWDALRKGKSREEVVNETADVMNLAIIIAVRNRVTPKELLEACVNKLKDRKRRDAAGYKA